jgi:hypothetical protein
MDEILEVVELFADVGELAGLLFRALGVIAILAGIGIWVFTDITILVPALLVVVGLALIIIPELLLSVFELF